MTKKECYEKKSYGNTVYFSFEKDNHYETHAYIIDLLKDIGFNSSYLMQLDVPFESMADVFMPFFTEFGIIDIFVGDSRVHLVFHFNNESGKKKYLPIIRKHFNY